MNIATVAAGKHRCWQFFSTANNFYVPTARPKEHPKEWILAYAALRGAEAFRCKWRRHSVLQPRGFVPVLDFSGAEKVSLAAKRNIRREKDFFNETFRLRN
jgi:hypothetical protein